MGACQHRQQLLHAPHRRGPRVVPVVCPRHRGELEVLNPRHRALEGPGEQGRHGDMDLARDHRPRTPRGLVVDRELGRLLHAGSRLAAVIMFFFLDLAVAINARAHWEKQRKLFWVYAGIAALMLVGFLVIPGRRIGGEHTVFWLETWEYSCSSRTGSFRPWRTGVRMSVGR